MSREVSAKTVVKALASMPDEDFKKVPSGIRIRAIEDELKAMKVAIRAALPETTK